MKSFIKSCCKKISGVPGLTNVFLMLLGIGIESTVRGVAKRKGTKKHKDPYINAKYEFLSKFYEG